MLSKVMSGFLILIVLVGTVGVSYDSHFCSGKLIKSQISVIPHDLSCGMKMKKNRCEKESYSRVCCSNERNNFQIDDDFVKYQSEASVYVCDFNYPEIVTELNPILLETKYEFIGYSPPPICEDFVILNQSFLI